MPYVVGHRGAAGLLPENTVAGFQYAIDLGCDYLECDVHLSRDQHLVVIPRRYGGSDYRWARTRGRFDPG